jgi:hypothetical protein
VRPFDITSRGVTTVIAGKMNFHLSAANTIIADCHT